MSEPVRTLEGLDFVGGNVGLDFANTINSRTAPEHDYLATYDALVGWVARVKAVDGNGTGSFDEVATNDPEPRHGELRRAHRLRDAVYRTFSAIAAGEPPPATDVRRVLRAYASSVAHAALVPEASGRVRDAPDADLSRPPLAWHGGILDPIAYAAGYLLLARDRPPIRECPGCGWLFLDRSRNGSRRWCDMQTCGSRDKMRRYYRSRRSSSTVSTAG